MLPKTCAVSRGHSTWACEENPNWRCRVPRKRVPGGECWVQVFMRKGIGHATDVLQVQVGEVLWLRSAHKAELHVRVLEVQGTARRLDLLVLDCVM